MRKILYIVSICLGLLLFSACKTSDVEYIAHVTVYNDTSVTINAVVFGGFDVLEVDEYKGYEYKLDNADPIIIEVEVQISSTPFITTGKRFSLAAGQSFFWAVHDSDFTN